jgi:ribosomal protein S2
MIDKNKIKKKNQQNLLLNSLFKSKNFYGEFLNKTNKNILPFLYGIRHQYSIINLKYTSIYLKRVFKLMQNTLKKNKKILIIGNSNDIKFLLNENFTKNNKNIIFYNQEWINGLITNNDQMNSFFKNNQINLILIIKTSIHAKYLDKELSTLNIPIVSFVNTNQNIENINYPIITNTKNIKSLYILMYLIRQLF